MAEQQSPLIIRSISFWLEDGNVVLVAPNEAGTQTSFRVHRGILARHSEVFEGMFTIPQPGSSDSTSFVDGCPSVHVTDTAEDWETILIILYDGGHKYFADESHLSWAQLSVMLRLGSKYSIGTAYDEAIRRLQRYFPPTWEQFRPFEQLYTLARTNISLEKGDVMELMELTYQLSLEQSIRRPILYACAHIPTSDLVDGIAQNKWTLGSLEACLLTKEQLNHAMGQILETFVASRNSPRCQQSFTCRTMFKEITASYILRFRQARSRPSGVHFLQAIRDAKEIMRDNVCTDCGGVLGAEFEKIRENVDRVIGI